MRYLTTGVTYRSHGLHKREDGEARVHESVLNHVCVTRDLEATVAVLTDSTTNHFPVIASIKVNKVAPTLKTMERRNFKALEMPALLRALDAWPWSDVYGIRDPDKVLDFITRGIVNGLDQAAPVKSITVREGSLPLYLRPDTLALMAKRDSLGRGPWYRAARNRITRLSGGTRRPPTWPSSQSWATPRRCNGRLRMGRSASLASLCRHQSQGRMARRQRETLKLRTPSMTITCKKCGGFGRGGESKTLVKRPLRPPGTEIEGEKILSHSALPAPAKLQRFFPG
jgi:hypothetical protein